VLYSLSKSVLLTVLMLWHGTALAGEYLFRPPFDSTHTVDLDAPMALQDVLALVAKKNPTLRGLDWQIEAARHEIEQAGVWTNPELGLEFEDVGWDAPGFSDAEIGLSLSQELELLGQRGARKDLARAGVDATVLAADLEAFDLYLDVKARFYALVHAQNRSLLGDSSVALAQSVIDDITFRIERGVGLQAERALAQLELQRVGLARDEIQQELLVARTELTSFWGSADTGITVFSSDEPDLDGILTQLPVLGAQFDSTRHVLLLMREAGTLQAARQLAQAEVRPSLTLSGGYKHLKSDGSSTLLFGIALPLPFFDRNRGTIAGLDAQLHSLEYRQERARHEASAVVRGSVTRLNQLVKRHSTLDTLLLPTASDVYHQLQQAYVAGRIPYSSLLEAERALIDLRFEHNDMILAIHEQIIEIERITGAILNAKPQ